MKKIFLMSIIFFTPVMTMEKNSAMVNFETKKKLYIDSILAKNRLPEDVRPLIEIGFLVDQSYLTIQTLDNQRIPKEIRQQIAYYFFHDKLQETQNLFAKIDKPINTVPADFFFLNKEQQEIILYIEQVSIGKIMPSSPFIPLEAIAILHGPKMALIEHISQQIDQEKKQRKEFQSHKMCTIF